MNFPKERYGYTDRPLFLHCDARGYPQITYTWLKWNTAIGSDSNVVRFENGTLQIKSFNDWNRGEYTCVARNKYGVASSNLTLSLLGMCWLDFKIFFYLSCYFDESFLIRYTKIFIEGISTKDHRHKTS